VFFIMPFFRHYSPLSRDCPPLASRHYYSSSLSGRLPFNVSGDSLATLPSSVPCLFAFSPRPMCRSMLLLFSSLRAFFGPRYFFLACFCARLAGLAPSRVICTIL